MSKAFVRVTRVRIQDRGGHRGAIFTGLPISPSGAVEDASSYLVVRASGRVLAGVSVQQGQWWEVDGDMRTKAIDVNGYCMTERQIDAVCATLVRPSGEHIVTLLADNSAFQGIGLVKARRLWEAFGERIYQLFDDADLATLQTQLTPEIAAKAVRAWSQYGDAKTLQWLQSHGFDIKLGRKVVEYFGAEAPVRVEEDPYRLLSFCATWRQADELARITFGIPEDDPRRLQGAVEEACYRLFAAGHTLVQPPEIMAAVSQILREGDSPHRCSHLIDKALEQGLSNGSYVAGIDGVQTLGALAMERVVAQALSERIKVRDEDRLLPFDVVDRLIADHETVEGLILNSEQRAAIHTACAHTFACIIGGAGVGKTTVLKVLYKIYDSANVGVVQIALAGRAAKRMQEATGRKASTIAGFLHSHDESELGAACVLVVDEASMVDIISMSRICEEISPHVRLVLVGDPHQLMPVGPGLVLHAVTSVPDVPVAKLKVVKRYGDQIRRAGESIRDGRWPKLSESDSADIRFLRCPVDEVAIAERVVDVYMRNPEDTQILCSHRRGPGGTKSLNAACQTRITRARKAIMTWNHALDRREHAGIYLGDVVLCTRNLWDEGLYNGSLGTVVQIEDTPSQNIDETHRTGGVLAWVEWDDGVRRALHEDMLDDFELGYAITVHKAQGSQWQRVIIPVVKTRMLDRTLLYTAITRAQKEVILLGDEAAARAAVSRPPSARLRRVALDKTLSRMLDAASEGLRAPD